MKSIISFKLLAIFLLVFNL